MPHHFLDNELYQNQSNQRQRVAVARTLRGGLKYVNSTETATPRTWNLSRNARCIQMRLAFVTNTFVYCNGTFWNEQLPFLIEKKDTTIMSESRYSAVPLQENRYMAVPLLVLKICQRSLKFRNLKGALQHKTKVASWKVQRRTIPEVRTQNHKHQGKQEGNKCKSSLPE
jgi:hypothetical protein